MTPLELLFFLFGGGVTFVGAVFASATTVALHEGWAQRRDAAPKVLAWSGLLVYLGVVMLLTVVNL